MGKINVLPDRLIGKIAAGEVVERPASVVKECMENALDSGADTVIVHMQKAGKILISVRDDGEGIEPDDIEKLFRRHTTSKIKDMEDLYNIHSLGFRGEALYSIGCVADVVLNSRSRNSSEAGREIHVRGGEKIEVKETGHPSGTTVEIRELFFNTPARKKFLKSDATEFRQALNVFIPYCLTFHGKKFVLSHNGRNIIGCSPSSDMLSRICEVINVEKKNMLHGEKEFVQEGFSAKLFLGDMNIQRPRRDQQFIFVNSRPVHSQSISYGVNQVYRNIFPRDVFPVFAVFIEMPSGDVDANIHPSKREVKLKNDLAVSSSLSLFTQEILTGRGHAATVKREVIYFQGKQTGGFAAKETLAENTFQADIFERNAGNESKMEERDIPMPSGMKLRTAAYAGSYRDKYLFFESGDTLLVIDQHAAHERINYEKLKRQFESGKVDVQQLLSPIIIKLSPEEMSSWEEGKEKMEEVGFITTGWDSSSIALHGYPQLVRNPEISVRSILAEKHVSMADRDKLARKACRGSVMAGEKVKQEEAVAIKEELLKCEFPFVCPHGRPTVVEFSESFFDRQFLR